ncbi:hypothetical protein JCM16303_005358 [Sporobolomyces ruberrimus]
MLEDTAPSPALAALMASTAPLDPARQKPAATPKPVSTGPIPMSMPAILVQPKNKHLLGALGKKAGARDENSTSSIGRKGKGEAGIPGARRKRRRWENAQLAGNPHLHRPSRSDFAPGPSLKHLSTTFAPPPSNFSRSTYSSPVSTDPLSSATSTATSLEMGQFSMSLKGLRKNLRTSVVGSRVRRGQGGRTEEVLEIMERELQEWLSFEGRVSPGFYHDGNVSSSKALDPTPLEDWVPPTPIDSLPDEPTSSSRSRSNPPPTLLELTRLPHTVVWLAPSPQHRFILHSLARYYRLQSFSRPLSPLDPTVRVTHILRPQVTRPSTTRGGVVQSGFDTPSATDWSSASALSTEVSSISASESEAEFTEDSEGVTTTDDEDGVTTDGEGGGGGEGGRTLEDLELSSGESEYGADRELGFSTDEEDGFTGGGVDSLASSFADLSATGPSGIGSAVPSTPTSTADTPRRSSLPFLPYTPPTALPSSLSTISTTPRPATRARGRRSLPTGGGRDSLESSPSRSPTRENETIDPVVVGKGEWKMPERSFVAWVFD